MDTITTTLMPDDVHADLLFVYIHFKHFRTDKHGRHFYNCEHCNNIFSIRSERLPVAAPGMVQEPGLVPVQAVESGK